MAARQSVTGAAAEDRNYLGERSEVPEQSCVGLNFKPRELVALEFRAQRNLQAIVNQADFILQERAELIQSDLIRLQGNRETGVVLVADRAVAQPPYELL